MSKPFDPDPDDMIRVGAFLAHTCPSIVNTLAHLVNGIVKKISVIGMHVSRRAFSSVVKDKAQRRLNTECFIVIPELGNKDKTHISVRCPGYLKDQDGQDIWQRFNP